MVYVFNPFTKKLDKTPGQELETTSSPSFASTFVSFGKFQSIQASTVSFSSIFASTVSFQSITASNVKFSSILASNISFTGTITGTWGHLPFYTSGGSLDVIYLTVESKLPFYNSVSVAKDIPLTT